ncbi:hypothetical protein K2E96_13540 [Pseudomonas sp. ERGC3:05]|nr:hypothetical protein K2E96_13540 [Pseudomonas sp. ERGC3:05]
MSNWPDAKSGLDTVKADAADANVLKLLITINAANAAPRGKADKKVLSLDLLVLEKMGMFVPSNSLFSFAMRVVSLELMGWHLVIGCVKSIDKEVTVLYENAQEIIAKTEGVGTTKSAQHHFLNHGNLMK